jgi:hypothetical protein
MEERMTADRGDRIHIDDTVRRRMIDGEGVGWAPLIVSILLLLGFAYLVFGAPTHSNNVQGGNAMAPAVRPIAPN